MTPTAHQSPPPLDLSSLRLVLVEDDILLADLLVTALRRKFGATQVRTFANGHAAVQHCMVDRPDLLMTDMALPDMNGRDVVRALRARWPDLRIIVITGQLSPTLPAEVLALGASGFLQKTSPFEEVELALRRVLANGLYFSAGARPSASPASGDASASAGSPLSVLTEREREIARLVASGMISKEIAARLGLSPRTIEKARAQLLAKLNLRDLPSLVRWCMQQGLA